MGCNRVALNTPYGKYAVFIAPCFAAKSNQSHRTLFRFLSILALLREKRISLKITPCGPDGALDEPSLAAAIAGGADLVAVSHASNVTGRVCDLGIIADCCHRAGAALLVDASQSAGLLETDMYALGINMLAFSGHKYLLGPEGTGGLILHGATELEPVLFGGTGVQAEKLTQPQDMPFRFEAGTPNGPAFAGLGGALDFLSCPEYPAMRKRACALAEDFAAHCMADKKLRVLGGERSSARFLPLVSFSATNCAPQDIGKFLWEHAGIICRAGLHCAPLVHRAAAMPEGTLRISFSIFNTPAELRILKDAIDRLPF